MRFFTIIGLMAALAATPALAQSTAPMLVVGGDRPAAAPASAPARPASEIEQERLLRQFPEWAITRAGSATGGSDADVVAVPPAPPSPANPAVPPSAAVPTPPAPPASPISTLWPADTVPIFMQSCVGFQPKKFVPCQCVIGNLMREMPHDEFLRLTAQNTIEQDVRLQAIRLRCATAPGQRNP